MGPGSAKDEGTERGGTPKALISPPPRPTVGRGGGGTFFFGIVPPYFSFVVLRSWGNGGRGRRRRTSGPPLQRLLFLFLLPLGLPFPSLHRLVGMALEEEEEGEGS